MNRIFRIPLSLLVGAVVLSAAGPSAAQTPTTPDTIDRDAPYVPTPRPVVTRMLEIAGVSESDIVYDLGSGDGRIPIIAAKEFGARGVGIEIDPALVAEARKKARAAGVADRVTFREGDLFYADLYDATVVTLYLWPEINAMLRPRLLHELDPGDRIVSHDYRMRDWEPDTTVVVDRGNAETDSIHLWTVP